MSDLVKKLERAVEGRNRTPAPRPQVQGVPTIVREGVLGNDSRPFSMHNFIQKGLATKEWAGARYEQEV